MIHNLFYHLRPKLQIAKASNSDSAIKTVATVTTGEDAPCRHQRQPKGCRQCEDALEVAAEIEDVANAKDTLEDAADANEVPEDAAETKDVADDTKDRIAEDAAPGMPPSI